MDKEKKEIEHKTIVSLYLPFSLLSKIDKLRGQISRNEFIKNLINQQIQVQA